MKHFRWNSVDEELLNPLLGRRMFHGERITVAKLRLKKFAVVPTHSHGNEQITLLESGKLRFVIDGEEAILTAGELLQIPPDAPHMVEALEDSVATDLFCPIREDWIRGDDSYLRRR